MDTFDTKYKKLNASQKQAVDTVEGPVIVIAGPGTGKTELLSMRVANILKQTDASAENILCLTFTESGASAMRERLTLLMGKEAYHVGVYTFHSFGSEIINKYSDYFYSGAHFQPADELATHQILSTIFDNLPHHDILAKKMNGEYTQLRYVQNSISDFKKSGLTADEIQRILLHNTRFMDHAEPLLSNFFSRPMHASMWQEFPKLIESIALAEDKDIGVKGIKKLSDILLPTAHTLLEENRGTTKTTALTAWRNTWLEKNEKGKFIFKDRKRQQKLYSASVVYYQYLSAMLEANLYDYDDMILRVVHALEVFPDLRYNLQEQYQYILVDEFQDTNGAQLRILLSLTENTNEGRPNILVVGDDDQAIYSFQGAELSNISTLRESVIDPLIVSLTDNYRSSKQILESSRDVITQGTDRLENTVDSLNKELKAHTPHSDTRVELNEYSTQQSEYSDIAENIATRIKNGQPSETIAVLARSHRDIKSFLPYLANLDVPVSYEHRDNILESPPIVALLCLGRTIHALASARLNYANTLLPELLSQPFWRLDSKDTWELSLAAHKEGKLWLEIMLESENDKLNDIASLITNLAHHSLRQSLEHTLDQMIGSTPVTQHGQELYSPFKAYYFENKERIEDNPLTLSDHLASLRHLRMSLKEYKPHTTLHLGDFVDYIDKSIAAGLRFMMSIQRDQQETGSVHVMTAHKSKGLEFDTVYIINATDNTWGSRSRGGVSRLSYPENIAIAPAGETSDERLRLFFVAMTRAKKELLISHATCDTKGKPTLRADFLTTPYWKPQLKADVPIVETQQQRLSWSETTTSHASLKQALSPVLKNYHLSTTHLNAFLDVTRGGPQGFLLQNLLHFPQAISAQAAFGSAVHNTLKHAQEQLNNTGEKRPIEDSLYDFESYLRAQRLEDIEYKRQLQKGSDILAAYIASHDDDFTPGILTERDFRHQGVTIGDARLTGILDRLRINRDAKTIEITDFKTGAPSKTWQGKADYEKIKLHKYRQQLMFYKLLIENSRDYKDYSVAKLQLSFIEPDAHQDFHDLDAAFSTDELAEFSELIKKVWQRIMDADFPDTSQYEQNYNGILAFEKYLINN